MTSTLGANEYTREHFRIRDIHDVNDLVLREEECGMCGPFIVGMSLFREIVFHGGLIV